VLHSCVALQVPLQTGLLVDPLQVALVPEQDCSTVRLWASAPQPVPLQRYSVQLLHTVLDGSKKPEALQQAPVLQSLHTPPEQP